MCRTGAALLMLALLGALPSRAAPWEPKAKPARQLLDEGRAAYSAGDYPAAAAVFLRSAEAETSHVARWNAGQAFASAGQWKRALGLFDQLVNDKTLPKARRSAVQDRQRIAARFVVAEDAADAARWDEAAAALRALITETTDLDRVNATHALESVTQRRAGAEAKERAEQEAAERAKAAAIVQPPHDDATETSAPGRPIRPAPPLSPRPSRLSDTIAVSLVGVGLVGIGVGAGFWWHAGQLEDDAKRESDQTRSDELRDSAATQRIIGQIALGAGAAVLIAGAIKLAIPPDAQRPTLATLEPVNGGAVLVLGGNF